MKNTEQLAVLVALEKAVKEKIKAVRQLADDEILEAYDDMGVEKIALKLDGTKVGDLTISFTKESYEVTDQEALNDFFADYGMVSVTKEIAPEYHNDAMALISNEMPEAIREKVTPLAGWDKCIEYVDGECTFYDSGMVIPGIKMVPRMVKNTMVRGCKPEDVIPITQRLGGFEQLLLEGE